MSAPRSLPRLLDEHRASLRGCHRCAERGADVAPVVSEARAPRAMLVGQAPGQTEKLEGRPFAGRAGKTLFRWLERAGISEPDARAHIYIAAITRCYPGPSPSGRGDRVPSPCEQAACASWLDDELRLVRPRLLIPVGRLAIDRFLEPAPLDRLVGRAHTVQHAGGQSLAIPLPHPSGASSWIHEGDHPELLARALVLLRSELSALGVVSGAAGGRSAA